MLKEYNKELFKNIEHSIIKEQEVKKELNINPFAKYIFYINNCSIIGYLYYSEIYDRVEINQIEVENIHRNCGIGTKLLEKLTTTIDKNITLEVKIDNYPAIALYKKFNFKEVATRKGYYQGIDGILMERINK